MPSAVLAPHIDIEARRPRRRCLQEACPTECTLRTQARTPAKSPAHTIQSICTHRSTSVAETPTTPTQLSLCHGNEAASVQQHCGQPPVLAQVLAFASPHTQHIVESTSATASSTPIRPAKCRSRQIPAEGLRNTTNHLGCNNFLSQNCNL